MDTTGWLCSPSAGVSVRLRMNAALPMGCAARDSKLEGKQRSSCCLFIKAACSLASVDVKLRIFWNSTVLLIL